MSHSPSEGPSSGSIPQGSTGRDPREDTRSAWATGGAVFAGLMLMINGVLAVLEGIVGIAKDSVYVRTRGDYVYKFDVTAWGVIHLVLGVIALLVGYFLLRGLSFARYIGIFIAGLNLIANFMFLPYQPIWAIVMIAIDTFVIWALATYHPRNLPYGSAL
ncbi:MULTISPECIES: DUF7144 family membrane protein [Streptomycetaceae]|jgi:hypothetical protein|uniref:DUF7144 family membrane protein n=1 Tax=Streptomycetaceae TaxID=2062 RepID=UPI00300AB9B9